MSGLGARQKMTTSARIELTTRGTLLGARQGRRRARLGLAAGVSPKGLWVFAERNPRSSHAEGVRVAAIGGSLLASKPGQLLDSAEVPRRSDEG
jgi:hypothetical protein